MRKNKCPYLFIPLFLLLFASDVFPTISKDYFVAPPSHAEFDALLKKYVSPTGQVNYKALQSDKTTLQDYCAMLSQHIPDDTWNRNAQMAYWINTYNAYTLLLILDNYPVTSIMKIDNGQAWKVKRIPVGAETYSLDQIENEILRPKYKDARIHFVINCAAKSCPPLLNEAFTADNLESYLQTRTTAFINNRKYNALDGNKATLSKIFDWYKSDFGKNLVGWINRFATVKLDSNAELKYHSYNWELNE